MPITSISRDWGVNPSIVRVITTDNLATITAANYLNTQIDEIQALNRGAFEWVERDLVAIAYNGGEDYFTRDAANNTFVVDVVPVGAIPLTSAHILVGNAAGIGADVAMTGDVAINNAGVTTIQPDSVDKAMLNPTVRPSHMIVFAGQLTTVGGAAAEAFAVAGAAAATDRAFVQIVDNGTSNVTALQAVVTNNTLTVTFSADPGADTVFDYQLIRATAQVIYER